MEIQIGDDHQAKLAELAALEGKGTEELAAELVTGALVEEARFTETDAIVRDTMVNTSSLTVHRASPSSSCTKW